MKNTPDKFCKSAESIISKFKESKNPILVSGKGSFIEKHKGEFVVFHKHSKIPLAKAKTFERAKALGGILEALFPLSKVDAETLTHSTKEQTAFPFEKKFTKSLVLAKRVQKFLEDSQKVESFIEKIVHDRLNMRLETARKLRKTKETN